VSSGTLLAPLLVTPTGAPPLRGEALGALVTIPNAALAWRDGILTHAGPASLLPESERPAPTVRATGAVIPGFVDCHTHLPFWGWRADEFAARLSGRTYRDVQGGGGGIYRSARLLARAGDDDVLEFCLPLVAEMLAHGTTALELKTGYGLSVEGELRQARLARRLASSIPQTTAVTLLACHAVPDGMERARWVGLVCDELIPAAADEHLVDAVDVYVEDIAFSVDDLRRVADTAQEHGLAMRCHADQLGHSGATEAAVAAGARSADHLNHVGAEGVAALGAAARTVGVLLPTSTLFLGASPSDVSRLVSSGAALGFATDFNPGTSPCLSIPEVIATAAALYRVPSRVALSGATLNAAWVLGLHDRLGSLEVGKRADFGVLDTEDPAMIAYRPGHNPVAGTWVAGSRVV